MKRENKTDYTGENKNLNMNKIKEKREGKDKNKKNARGDLVRVPMKTMTKNSRLMRMTIGSRSYKKPLLPSPCQRRTFVAGAQTAAADP